MKASTSALVLALILGFNGVSFAQSSDELRQRVFDENDRTLECCDARANAQSQTIDDGVIAGDDEGELE